MKKIWSVYLLECLDGSYYTGVTNDVDKRMNAHAKGKGERLRKILLRSQI